MSISGRCLCGAVRFTIDPPTLWCAHCHCGMCRRAHGAAFVTWVGVPEDRFHLTVGEDMLRGYASSQEAKRRFCGHCGSPMFFASSRWPGEVHVAVGCLIDPLDREPAAHVFFDEHVDWVVLGDGLPRRGGTTGTEPIEENSSAS